VDARAQDAKPHWARRWVWPALTFVIGGVLSPLLVDAYSGIKAHFVGRQVTVTDERSIGVVGRDGQLVAPYTVNETGTGQCEPYSLVMGPKSNSFRCGVSIKHRPYVADPCFAMSGGRAAACIAGPWDHKVLKVKLTKAIPFDASFVQARRAEPWALEIQDPSSPKINWQCLPETGATGTFAGYSPTFACSDPEHPVRIKGDKVLGKGAEVLGKVRIGPDRLSTVHFLGPDDKNEIRTAKVAVAWY
jgi:hypothetical protein